MSYNKMPAAISFVACSFLVACGGGGGGGGSTTQTVTTSPVTTTTTTTTTTPTRAITTGTTSLGKTTATYADATLASAIGLASTITAVSPTVTSTALTSIGLSYSESGTSSTQTITSNGLQSGGVATLVVGNTTNMLGGTTYTYSRFGYSDVGELDKANAAKVIDRIAPFHVAEVYSSYTPVTATYQGKSTGVFIIDGAVSKFGAQCDVSVNYSAGATTTITPTFSNCVDSRGATVAMSGGIASSKTGSVTTLSAAGLSFTSASGTVMTIASVKDFSVLVGGPNGEEIVGSAAIIGQATVSGIPASGIFILSFGGKK